MPTPTPHRISDADHKNRRELRELRRQLVALKVEGRRICARNRAQWVAEKTEALVAFEWARALPESEQAFYLTGRWRGEPLGSCVLRHREQRRRFFRILADALARCAAENTADAATPYESIHSSGEDRVLLPNAFTPV